MDKNLKLDQKENYISIIDHFSCYMGRVQVKKDELGLKIRLDSKPYETN